MNVLAIMLNDEIRTGGHKRFLELVRGLAGRGHRVCLMKSAALPLEIQGVAMVSVPAAVEGAKSSAAKIKDRVSSGLGEVEAMGHRFDVSLTFGENYIEAATLIKERFGIPILCAIRSSRRSEFLAMERPGPSLKGLVKYVLDYRRVVATEARVARRADRVVFQSEYDRRRFLRHHPLVKRRTAVVRNNCSASWFDERYGGSNAAEKPVPLLFIGALDQRKGILVLLEALTRLLVRGVPVSADIVGFGSFETQVAALVAEGPLKGAVRLHGRNDDVMPFLKNAGLLVVPSLYDSYPNVALEALHVGTPVIGSSVGGIPDILEYRELLFRPGHAAALAAKIEELIASPERYRQARELCARRREHFVFDWVAEFERVLAEASQGAAV
jgi:glycosyltransferase involved in cell wall biosynthesis